MNTRKTNEENTVYTYKTQDGNTWTIRAGENGVTEEMIAFLRENDRETELQDFYQEKNCCYSLQNVLACFENEALGNETHPLENIADPSADIMDILFPESTENSPLMIKLDAALAQLTPAQLDLIHELYGCRKSMAEVAREHGVSRQAINNRQGKILRRLKKLMNVEDR